jgi:hypothetical protein
VVAEGVLEAKAESMVNYSLVVEEVVVAEAVGNSSLEVVVDV